jgi:dolichyl-diphosphooligosaccharide--protein glycosyltransferase
MGIEATNRKSVGLWAALFIAIIPTIISRGVAGSYDNEAVSIWAMVNTFWLWIKAINTGYTSWSLLCSLSYFYMVVSWGGYSFIINIIPLFVLACIFVDKLHLRIYVAYTIFYTVGSVLTMTIPFAAPNVYRSSEHLLSHLTFVAINGWVILKYVYNNSSKKTMEYLWE